MTSRPAKRTSPPGRPAAARQPAATDTVWTGPPDHPGRGGLPMAPEQQDGPARRAGGHVDRGDGRGWVLEREE